jgi:hypothetical protein
MQPNTIAGGASGLAFLISQVLFLPSDALTWPRVVAICVCAVSLAALGYFSKSHAATPPPPAARPSEDAPPVVKP